MLNQTFAQPSQRNHYTSLSENNTTSINQKLSLKKRIAVAGVIVISILCAYFVYWNYKSNINEIDNTIDTKEPETKVDLKNSFDVNSISKLDTNNNISLVENASKLIKLPDTVSSALQKNFYHQESLCNKAATIDNDMNTINPPYLYLTFHGGNNSTEIRTVCKYTRNGQSLGAVLIPNELHSIHSLRGMIIYDDKLYVAESWKEDSKILRYSKCDPLYNNRRILETILVAANDKNAGAEGLIHPYGFANRLTPDPYFYISAQGTRSVFRIHKKDGTLGPISIALREFPIDSSNFTQPSLISPIDKNAIHKQKSYFEGTFLTLNNDEIRGIAFDKKGILYVANKQKGVMMFNKDGYFIGNIPHLIHSPISIYFCEERNSIWIGSSIHHKLFEIDVTTLQLKKIIRNSLLKHPAGIVTYKNSLFVVSQAISKVLEFSMLTTELLNVVLMNLPDKGERIILSDC